MMADKNVLLCKAFKINCIISYKTNCSTFFFGKSISCEDASNKELVNSLYWTLLTELIWLWFTSWPWSRIHSLEYCFLASIRMLNMVHTEKGTLKSVDLLDFCILASKAALVLCLKEIQLQIIPQNTGFLCVHFT